MRELLNCVDVYPFGQFCALGVTAGAHRLWSHRSYKANLPLRIFLSILFASCKQHDIYEWVRDHRVHHKYSDTYADPHSIKRGFFFSHIGWMVTKKPKEVHTKFEKLDLSDLENDPVVRFQKKYFNIWSTFWCYIVPTFIPWYFWNEDPWISFCAVAVARQGLILHYAWSVNSIAHRYGNKPYDRNICPTDDKIYAILALGEGWHNYHHAFPWDYRSSEIGGFKYNMTTSFIDLMGKIGWASHFKMATTEAVKKRAESKGDGSRIQYVGLINGS
ncbi:hypothetical protein NQ317_003684 [Molorchus minor]|uniref:Fatty acid desaturase domain-containing protein n=1 Tax=Molorchus minor TaxID=1323400 RepID=A0ABQ9JRD5_9CUCU|nr:hypothetical protein NQ317_003684 [Molorchus minor]